MHLLLKKLPTHKKIYCCFIKCIHSWTCSVVSKTERNSSEELPHPPSKEPSTAEQQKPEYKITEPCFWELSTSFWISTNIWNIIQSDLIHKGLITLWSEILLMFYDFPFNPGCEMKLRPRTKTCSQTEKEQSFTQLRFWSEVLKCIHSFLHANHDNDTSAECVSGLRS